MKRLNSISLLRCVSWVTIIVYHILSVISPGKGLKYFPFNFAVQVFIFISGLLYSKKEIIDVKHFYKKNIFKILLPINLLLLLEWGLVAIVDIHRANPLNWLGFLQSGRYALDHLWFIPFILLCYLFLPILQKAFNTDKTSNVAKCFVCLLILTECVYCLFFDVQVVFLVFVLGYFLGKRDIELKISTKGGIFGILLAVAAAWGYFFARQAWLGGGVEPLLQNIYLWVQHYLIVFIAIGVSFAFLFLFKFTNKHKPYWLCKFSDKYSFHMYLHHQMFVVGAMSLIGFTTSAVLDGLLIFVATFICAILMFNIGEFINKEVLFRQKADKFDVSKNNN